MFITALFTIAQFGGHQETSRRKGIHCSSKHQGALKPEKTQRKLQCQFQSEISQAEGWPLHGSNHIGGHCDSGKKLWRQ